MIAAIFFAAQASAATFAPPLDRPLQATTESIRTDAGITRRFTNARRILFRRTKDGFRAEVTIEAGAPADADDDPAAMFRAGFARIAGRTVVLHLDRTGEITAINDQAALWSAMIAGVAGLAPTGSDDHERKRAGRIRAITATLGRMPAEHQRAALGSLVAPVIAMDIVAGGESPPRPVRVPATSPYGMATLDGIRMVKRVGGRLEATVTAEGPVTIPGSDTPAAAGRISLETVRRIDPGSGLVLESVETVRTVAANGSLASERSSTTRLE